MIIVEGPDGAGKSTLVRKICSEFRLVERRYMGDRSKMFEDTVPRTMHALARAVEGIMPPEVYDRLYYSELVYFPLTGGKCRFNDQQQAHVEQVIEALECPVILCLPPLENVIKNVEATEKGQMEGVVDNIKKIYDSYQWEAQPARGHNMTLYSYLAPSHWARVRKQVGEYLEAREERSI